jgi:hypothetical protein
MQKFTKRRRNNKHKTKSLRNRRLTGGTGSRRSRAASPSTPDPVSDPAPLSKKELDSLAEYKKTMAREYLEHKKDEKNPRRWATWLIGFINRGFLNKQKYDEAVVKGDNRLEQFNYDVSADPVNVNANFEDYTDDIDNYFRNDGPQEGV